MNKYGSPLDPVIMGKFSHYRCRISMTVALCANHDRYLGMTCAREIPSHLVRNRNHRGQARDTSHRTPLHSSMAIPNSM